MLWLPQSPEDRIIFLEDELAIDAGEPMPVGASAPEASDPPETPWNADAGTMFDMEFGRVPDGMVIGPRGQIWCVLDLHLAQAPVTNQQYQTFLDASGYDGEPDCPGLDIYRAYDGRYLQAWRSERPGFDDAQAPVVCVSWLNACAFAEHRTQSEHLSGRLAARWHYRLPTEAEWQHAAMLGRPDMADHAGINFAEAIGHPTPCNRFKGDRLGRSDMLGNVFEWCANVADPDRQATPAGRDDPGYRANRGGSWASSADSCTTTYRHWNAAQACHDRLGFRLALVRDAG